MCPSKYLPNLGWLFIELLSVTDVVVSKSQLLHSYCLFQQNSSVDSETVYLNLYLVYKPTSLHVVSIQ